MYHENQANFFTNKWVFENSETKSVDACTFLYFKVGSSLVQIVVSIRSSRQVDGKIERERNRIRRK